MVGQAIIEKTTEHVLKTMAERRLVFNQRDTIVVVCSMVIDVIQKNAGSYSKEKKQSMCLQVLNDICRHLNLLHSVTHIDGIAIIMDWFDQHPCGCKWRSCW